MKKQKQNIYLRIPDEVKDQLVAAADRMGISLNALINQILYQFLKAA